MYLLTSYAWLWVCVYFLQVFVFTYFIMSVFTSPVCPRFCGLLNGNKRID